MILLLLDHNEERIADIEAWEVTRDRELGGFDILTFKTRYRELEKRHRIVLRMPDLKWQEYIIDGIIESRDYVEVTCQHAICRLTVILLRIADRKGLAIKHWTASWNTRGGLDVSRARSARS